VSGLDELVQDLIAALNRLAIAIEQAVELVTDLKPSKEE